ncbi:MAG: hypothetical protein Ct9H90mP27_0330 [Gammaproteobacteria bacterium]|nr:MAG: hypothetical protein Ct9H90mP27_0330 [Gammaproteobacteria bacterium]
MSSNVDVNVRPDPENELVKIADYVVGHEISSKEAMETAKNCLMDTLGCGFLAQKIFPGKRKTFWAPWFPVPLYL